MAWGVSVAFIATLQCETVSHIVGGMPTEVQISKVKEALRLFAASGSIRQAIADTNLKGLHFYEALRAYPALELEYLQTQQMRAEYMLDQAFTLLDDAEAVKLDPRGSRVRVDGLIKLAEKYHPRKFGDKLQVELTAKPSLANAIDARFNAILSPQRNLVEVEHAQDAEFAMLTDQRNTECSSVSEPANAKTQDDALAQVFDD